MNEAQANSQLQFAKCRFIFFSSFLGQRAFSPEGLSEMWNEMVKDEEITFNGEETAHPGIVL